MVGKLGKLISIEGIDGSGKTTTIHKVKEQLEKRGEKVQIMKFPAYKTRIGQIITDYLAGKFGDATTFSPEIAICLYALNRAEKKEKIEELLKEGHILILDRWIESNMAFQSAKIDDRSKRIEVVNFIKYLEYDILKLPRTQYVFVLDVPPEIAVERIERRGEKKTGHEKLGFMRKVREAYIELSKTEGWHVIECVEAGREKTPEEISEEIVKIMGYKV